MAVTKVLFNMRLKTMMVLAAVAGSIIALRLIDIQILRHNAYLQMAERNRTQILYQTAPRGRVFTADGVAVASNAPSFSLYYLGGNTDQGYLSRLSHDFAPHLHVTEENLRAKLQAGASSGKAVLLAENLSTKSTVALQELQYYYPGIYLIEETKRNYPYGIFASHLLGYLGSLDEKQWRKRNSKLGYRLSSKIGKNGIEKKFEQELKGKDGGVYLEVDYRGRVKSIIEDKKWAAGSDVYLTLDFAVQQAAEAGLKNSLTGRGAAVALDPRTGAVLALASAPAYDPNIFVPYSDEEYDPESKKINEYNLALQGIYPPASTFKIITSSMALEEKVVSLSEAVNCPGHKTIFGHTIHCHEKHFLIGITLL